MSVLIFLIVLYTLLGLSMMRLFEKAGIPGWKAVVPGLAAVEWCKMTGRKPWYALWLLFPIVNIFIYAGLCIDMVRSFGKFGFWQSVIAVLYAPIPFFMIGRNERDRYNGPVLEQEREFHRQYHESVEKQDHIALAKLKEANPYQKTPSREWAEAVIFAIFAAAFIRMFLIEAYVIPTSSMEGTLKVGDFLFVSKAHYGIRTPMTVIQFPLVHNRFSGLPKFLRPLERESYFEKPALPYYRLPAIESIDRFEPIVFNFPAGDSVIITPGRTYDIYQWRREGFDKSPQYANLPVVTRPIDKKDHYIKRCVGMPGDTLQIIDGQLFIDGKKAPNPTHQQFTYRVSAPGSGLNLAKIEALGVNIYDLDPPGSAAGTAARAGYFNLDAQQAAGIAKFGANVNVERVPTSARYPGYVFPNDAKNYGAWTVDDFGPLYIPKAGATTPLTPENIAFYERIIRVYEGNELVIRDGKFFLNGKETTTYTFKQNYYWMMGDNRHNSEDSRVWGYVPEDHIVGKPLFIWFSTKNGSIRNGINWDRIFTSAGRM